MTNSKIQKSLALKEYKLENQPKQVKSFKKWKADQGIDYDLKLILPEINQQIVEE